LRGRLRRRIATVNQVIREAANRYDTVLLDAWAEPRTRRHAMWSIDRIHPSTEGHRLIAASVAELLGVPVPASAPQPFPRLADGRDAPVRRGGRVAAAPRPAPHSGVPRLQE
jgi:hypothetical protein